MPKRRIFTIGFELAGDEFEQVGFDSDQTLLDADIILFEPSLGYCNFEFGERWEGEPILSEEDSFAKLRRVNHWRSEIVGAVNAGKLVIVFLKKPIKYFRYTGNQQFSGTGRSRVTTKTVLAISSYDSVPHIKRVAPKSGNSIRLLKDAAFLKEYWDVVSELSPYEVEIETDVDSAKTLMRSTAGDRIVGVALPSRGGGALLFLPPISHDDDTFLRDAEADEEQYTQYWTPKAIKFAKRLVSILVGVFEGLRQNAAVTPPPSWASSAAYRLAEERKLETDIAEGELKLASLQQHKSELEKRLRGAGTLRRLLYEQGKPLESAVLEAMRLFGFEARSFVNQESEFDVVFESPEGRCLGEVEGKDNKAVNIEKFSQLERNLQEDFAREDVQEYAKGVLFGNAFRLASLDKRAEFFTEKCLSAAKRISAALVRTPDLFLPARYIKESPSDLSYAKLCRDAIFVAKGTIAVFPAPPTDEQAVVIEEAKGAEKQKTLLS